METRVAKLEERTVMLRDDIKETCRRLNTIETDITVIKVSQGAMTTKVDAIAVTAEETRQDIRKAKTWLIVTILSCILSVVAAVVISTLT